MLRADKILKLLPKVNQSFSVCPHYQKHTLHQLCLNQVCQLVLYEHVKPSNLLIVLKLWLYAGPLKEIYRVVRKPIPRTLVSGVLVETCIACLYTNQNIDKTVSMLKYRNRLTVVLATGLHW